jgi:GNAT superfamily N-acetyltransferase
MAVTTTHLQMLARPTQLVAAPREGITVIHARRPTVAFYRFLYNSVGHDWQWTSRRKLPDAELARIIQDPHEEVHVLFVEGVPAGFADLDRRVPGEIEIVQFGLVPEFIGQGLGKYFLHWVIDKAFSYHPNRLWLHTCTNDHPAALPNYLKAGLAIYKEEVAEKKG